MLATHMCARPGVRLVLLVVAVAVAVLLGVGGGAALGAPGPGQTGRAGTGLELSRDGTHWAARLDAPLFLPGLAWTPGEVRTSSVLVRNRTDRVTDVEVALTRTPADTLLTVEVMTGATVRPVAPGPTASTLRVRDLAPGGTARITLRAVLSDLAPGATSPGDVVDLRVTRVPRATRSAPGRGIVESAHLELAPLFLGLGLIAAAAASNRRRARRS